jgi:ABC-type branched-subunit amino acid transport system substrate-binding protein
MGIGAVRRIFLMTRSRAMASSTFSTPPNRRQMLAVAAGAGCWASGILPVQAAPAPSEVFRFGQSAPVSGPGQQIGLEYQRGLRLAFDAANAGGGVQGKKLELLTRDDGYSPDRAAANTQQLIGDEGAMALLGYVGGDSIFRCASMAAKEGVPFIAPLSGAESLRQQPSRWVQFMRPSLKAECGLIARTLATSGFNRIGVLVQNDLDGEGGFQSLEQALKDAGLPPPIAVGRVSRPGMADEALMLRESRASARTLFYTNPTAVVCLASYQATASVLRGIRELGYRGAVYATSLSGPTAIAQLLGPQTVGLSVTQVMPSPFDVSRPLVLSYQQQLKDSAPTASPDYVSFEGYVVGSVIVQALKRMPRGGGRAQLMSALDGLASGSGLDLGGVVLHWESATRQMACEVSLTILDASGRPRR